jgi:hypothetical protein
MFGRTTLLLSFDTTRTASKTTRPKILILLCVFVAAVDRLCGLVVRVPGYRPRGRRLDSGATRFSEK